MPTETVYGLAANALDPAAVAKTFEAKGRPADNPLIVHLASPEKALGLTTHFSETALTLGKAFWPGPLTLVLPKLPRVPNITTGGLDTVAVRVPAHPVARALIQASGVPLSAPSANPFMGLSPTRAEHVSSSLVDLVLDGGPCEVGLESTVIDVTGSTPRLLRPGGISKAQIEAMLGRSIEEGHSTERRSPGMYPRHYAPRTPIRLVSALEGRSGVALNEDPIAYGASLYATLHDLDSMGLQEILIERPPDSPEWEAVWDRLRRATNS